MTDFQTSKGALGLIWGISSQSGRGQGVGQVAIFNLNEPVRAGGLKINLKSMAGLYVNPLRRIKKLNKI